MNLKYLAILVVILVIIGAAVFLMGPRGGEETTTQQGTTTKEGMVLKIITRHASEIQEITRERFLKTDIAEKYKIVDLQFYSPHVALWRDTILKQEPDVAWGGGPALFNELIRQDLLAPITDPETLKVVESLPDNIGGSEIKHYENGKLMWVAAAISSFGFSVNEPLLEKYGLPEPKSWKDLASPDMAKILPKPAISYARALTSTSHTRIYQIILQKYGWEEGWEILARMAANGRPYGGSVEALTAVETGETPIGIMIDFYGYGAQIEFPGLKYILPFNESIVNGDPIALLKTSKHPEAAQAFIRWVLSTEGQKIWLNKKINRMPVREDVFDTPEGKARTDLKRAYEETVNNIGIPFDEKLATEILFSLKYYFDSVYSDPHDQLVRAWTKLVKALKAGKITQEQFEEFSKRLGEPLTWTENDKQVTFTLEYAKSINEKLRDTVFANKMQKIWRQAAVERYEKLYNEIPDP
ncbi:MAG: ABC transporter substrate-binding protein [Candidatus Korarchaeota archaeon]|nr:ABC transporter substrate-binding protein [Candidatus Korarchaeota archaeon]